MTDPTPTPQAPPQGLTDAQLLELAEDELCIDDIQDSHEQRYCIELVTDELLAFARAAIAAHEAARPQLPPNYVDPEHTGENRKLLEVFYLACEAEGGTADEIILRGLRAAIAADRAANTPSPSHETR